MVDTRTDLPNLWQLFRQLHENHYPTCVWFVGVCLWEILPCRAQLIWPFRVSFQRWQLDDCSHKICKNHTTCREKRRERSQNKRNHKKKIKRNSKLEYFSTFAWNLKAFDLLGILTPKAKTLSRAWPRTHSFDSSTPVVRNRRVCWQVRCVWIRLRPGRRVARNTKRRWRWAARAPVWRRCSWVRWSPIRFWSPVGRHQERSV